MTGSVVIVRVDGHGTEHLSAHASGYLALQRLALVAETVWADRFGYPLPAADERTVTDLLARLGAEGWRASVSVVEVEL